MKHIHAVSQAPSVAQTGSPLQQLLLLLQTLAELRQIVELFQSKKADGS